MHINMNDNFTSTGNKLILNNAINYTTQTLTDVQKTQARTNSDDVQKIVDEVIKNLSSCTPVMKHQCNNCGGVLEMDYSKHIFVCPYCSVVYAIGTTMSNDPGVIYLYNND